jgi:leucyl aminopeptidase
MIFVPSEPTDSSFFITVFTDENKVLKTMKQYGLNKNNTNVKVIIDGKKRMFLSFDKEKPFISAKNIANSIKGIKDDICIDLRAISNEFKFLLLQYISKYTYTFTKYITDKTRKRSNNIYILDRGSNKSFIQSTIKIISCGDITRNLENEPANKLSPDKFCHRVKSIFQGNKHVKITILNENQMKQKGLNLILAIGKSSVKPPRFMILELIKNPKLPNICLIGKTVVYDSGGLNLKKAGMNWEMKTDKSGGCVVTGIFQYFVSHYDSLNCNIIGLLPVVENLVSNDVSKPGDIVTAYNKKTVEILNIDAEGRLIMADALAYTANFNPKYVFDFATLTGWAEKMHCDTAAVSFSLNERLRNTVSNIGERVGERVWQMPHWKEYDIYIKSDVADYKNADYNCKADGYIAALFLMNFVPKHVQRNFIHFDICNNFNEHLAIGNTVSIGIELVKHVVNHK